MSLFAVNGHELLPTDGSAKLYEWVLGDTDPSVVMQELLDSVPWASQTITMFGKQYVEPRRTAWFGDEGASYTYSGITMTPHPWTPLLQSLRDVCEQNSGSAFNSVLLNLYRDGNDKMGWHADDEPELGTEPVIASLSLGATRKFRFRHRVTKEVVECELPTGSLVVMSGLSQKCWVHEVPRQKRVNTPRINLTFRKIQS
ncbi:MAG: alpha-ketoglutarate-dependent dioxygenase AlkB [Actinobacteria bacterium]|nr:alpha-ketoglutarate-dependent dioxygenase AlkB [Actinomycetota bacterium]